MTTPGGKVPAAPAEDVRLARLHLRLGMHAVARAELEDLGGRGALDTDGLAVLAEARWRTGDLEGAADVADAHLGAGGSDPVAIVIAAEAAAMAGEAADARALVDRLRGLEPAALDAIFAGIAHRAHWPGAPAGTPASGGPAAAAASAASAPGKAPAYPPRASAVPGPAEVLESHAGLWDDEPSAAATAAAPAGRKPAAPTWVEPARAKGHADPELELEAARDELSVAPERGLLRLALVLRLDPTLAPDVLDAVRLRREPAAIVLRGDAERLLGRHLEAEAAFADAIELIEREALAGRGPTDRDPHPTPAPAPGSGHHGEPDPSPDRQEDS